MKKSSAKKAGRPRKPDAERRDPGIAVRLSDDEKQLLVQASERAGRPLAAFVRECALAEAVRILGKKSL